MRHVGSRDRSERRRDPKNHRSTVRRAAAAAAALAAFVLLAGAASERRTPDHLEWAHRLIDGVSPAANEYDSHPTIVTWAGAGGATETRNRSVCSSLVAHLMMQAYGYRRADFDHWMHTTFPQAQDFHAAIVDGHGFDHVATVAAVRVGDIIAIKYPAGHHPTGHVLVVAALPTPHAATEPVVPHTTQYEMSVIDSSRTGHGPTDTRHYAKGKFHSGIGQGTMRLYTDATGTFVGYSWSITHASEYYSQDQRHLAIGRLNFKVAPGAAGAHSDKDAADEPDGDVEPPG